MSFTKHNEHASTAEASHLDGWSAGNGWVPYLESLRDGGSTIGDITPIASTPALPGLSYPAAGGGADSCSQSHPASRCSPQGTGHR